MRRRDVLRTAAAGAVGLALPSTHALAHPGPYRPYGTLELKGAKEAVVGDDGSTVYVAATSGFAVVDVSTPSDPRVLAERRRILAGRENGPLQQIHDVKVDGDRLAVVGPANPTGDEVLHGMAVYDVADPAAPELVGFHGTSYPIHNCFVRDGMAYLTGNDGRRNPLVMVDVSGDELQEVGRWSVLEEEPVWQDVGASVWAIHDVWVHDGLAFVAHWDAGTWIVDVSDPADATAVTGFGAHDPVDLAKRDAPPAREESLQLPGNSHYTMVDDAGTLLGVGREAWEQDAEDDRLGGPGGIDLFDVSDPANPTHLSTIEAPSSPDPSIGGVWTTSHNFDLRDGWLYSSWYRAGVKIHDVTDPTDPQELVWWRDPETTEFWTAKRARGCFVGSSRRNPSGRGSAEAAIFTFPDHPGMQADPPTLTATTGNAPGNDSGGGTGGTGGNGSDGGTGGGTGGNGSEPEGTTTADGGAGTGATTTATATESGGQAGFGIAAGLVGVGLGAWRWWRRE